MIQLGPRFLSDLLDAVIQQKTTWIFYNQPQSLTEREFTGNRCVMRSSDHNIRPTGPGGLMIAAAWILVLGILTAYFSGWLDGRENPNQEPIGATSNQGVHEVRLRQNRAGHYIAIGQINDMPVKFLLDTGATHVSVPQRVAKKLNLKAGHPERVETANGPITTYFTRLAKVKLGTIELRDVRANINPHMNSDDILLGMSFLRHLELVQRDGNLTLRQHPSR